MPVNIKSDLISSEDPTTQQTFNVQDRVDNFTKRLEVHPLHLAASRGDIPKMRIIHANNTSLISTVTENGWTPLYVAAAKGQVQAMEWLHKKEILRLYLKKGPPLCSCYNK